MAAVAQHDEPLELTDAIDPPPSIGTDERRMHVRAYNKWASLLAGRTYPSIADLDPSADADFGHHSVLLNFSSTEEPPRIAYIGATLALECGLTGVPRTVADVPARSLLSRLTDHHLQIIANRAPVGFEAEFDREDGVTTAYRGILMPFSSDGETIDHVLGVLNWKQLVHAPDVEELRAELEALVPGPVASTTPAWENGPHSAPLTLVVDADEQGEDQDDEGASIAADPDEGEPLADWLAHARDSADAVKHADSRSRAALYRALGHAYDFALLADGRPEEYAELLADTGLKVQARAPMTPVVKLIFGADYDKTRLTEFAAALAFARRNGLPKGGMPLFLEKYPGGLKALVAAERRERRPAERVERVDTLRQTARTLAAQAVLSLPGDDEFVVLVARRLDAGRVAVIGAAPEDKPLIDRALRHIVDDAEVAAAA